MTWTAAAGPLRQGDICVVPAFPIWDIDRAQRQVGPQDVTEGWVLPRHKALEWDQLSGSVAVAVCSHDCDLENPRERTGVIVAPLVRVPANPKDDRYAKIMASGITDTQIDYVSLFPVSYQDSERSIEAVIDFSAMTSYAKADKAVPKLLSTRVIGCDEGTRESIRRKLALFLGRPYQDPRSDGPSGSVVA